MSRDFNTALGDSVRDLSEETKSDIILYCGPLNRPEDVNFISECSDAKKHHAKAILFLTSFGGQASVAYRIARHLQRTYECFTLYIHSFCKSAGTLLALGATDIVMSEFGEMGPLDVQLKKIDEIGESSSGLTITDAFDSLKERAFDMFEDFFLGLRFKSGQQISTKSAMDIAANLTVGLYGPIYGQIDPLRFGENQRAVRQALDYGERIQTDNLKQSALYQLINGYSDHGFIIDYDEAKELFNKVRRPSDKEVALGKLLENLVDNHIQKDKTLTSNLTHSYIESGKQEEGGIDGELSRKGCTYPNEKEGSEVNENGKPREEAAAEGTKKCDDRNPNGNDRGEKTAAERIEKRDGGVAKSSEKTKCVKKSH